MTLKEDIAFDPTRLEQARETYRRLGFVILRGLYSDSLIEAMERELADAQARLIAGELETTYGTDMLDPPGAEIDGQPFRHYVIYCTKVSPAAEQASNHEVLASMAGALFGGEPWMNDYARFGVVYQDARPDAGSQYSRIGWHSDFHADEDNGTWPSFAFTIHLDGTSPANGFLRVVPGSHLLDADKDDLGARRFDALPGEVPVFAERGDVILHDYKLWHGAARGTADGAAGRRRHVRGGWYAGSRLPADHGNGPFYKNAAR